LDPRFVPINALLALSNGEAGWPRILGDAGYQVVAMEARISTAATDGKKRSVQPDAVLASESLGSVALSECKSGTSGRREQLEALGFVTIAQARSHIGFTFVPKILQPLVVGVLAHESSLRAHMAAAHVNFPLLLVGDGRARLSAPIAGLDPFDVKVPAVPRIIEVDVHSSEDIWQRHLQSVLAEVMAQDQRQPVSVSTLIERVMPYWPTVRSAGQAEICKKVHNVLRRMAAGHWADEFHLEEPHQQPCGYVTILRTPATNDPHGVTQGWQRVGRVARRTMGRKDRELQSMMDPLFGYEELGLAAEVEPERDNDKESPE
jgi:hypothetical protein